MRETAIKALLGLVIVFLVGTFIWRSGYDTAEEKYQAVIKEYNDKQLAKASRIEGVLSTLVTNQENTNSILVSSIDSIKGGLRGKTLVVYKDGKCLPSQEFLDSRTQAINRANGK